MRDPAHERALRSRPVRCAAVLVHVRTEQGSRSPSATSLSGGSTLSGNAIFKPRAAAWSCRPMRASAVVDEIGGVSSFGSSKFRRSESRTTRLGLACSVPRVRRRSSPKEGSEQHRAHFEYRHVLHATPRVQSTLGGSGTAMKISVCWSVRGAAGWWLGADRICRRFSSAPSSRVRVCMPRTAGSTSTWIRSISAQRANRRDGSRKALNSSALPDGS